MERKELFDKAVELAHDTVHMSDYPTEQRYQQTQDSPDDKAIALLAVELLIMAATDIVSKRY